MGYSCEECKNKDTITCTVCANYNGLPDKFEPRARTNYDKLIRKTPEELAKWFDQMIYDCDLNDFPCKNYCPNKSCRAAWLEWLEKEV